MKKLVFYWSPHIDCNVATCKAVLNSANSLKKYSKKFEPVILNNFGEWNYFDDEINDKQIKIENIFNIKLKLPIHGFFKSRLFYVFFSLISIIPVFNLIKKKKPDIVIIHLITIPILVISKFFNLKTKFILRISGFPKLNFFRKFMWKFLSSNLSLVFCPTSITKEIFDKNRIFKDIPIKVLEDPIVEIKKINIKKNEVIEDLDTQKYIISIGRLTKQKNFDFLIDSFHKMSNEINDYKLIIIGTGELEKQLKKKVEKLELEKKIIFLGYKDNVFKYIKKSSCFVLTSNWEDPGFVIIESALCETPIICSSVYSGPIEFIEKDNVCGFLYEKGNYNQFYERLTHVLSNSDKDSIKKRLINAKRKAKKYSLFQHQKKLSEYLKNF